MWGRLASTFEILVRWAFYIVIVGFALVFLAAMQVRQQIKNFNNFIEFAQYENEKKFILQPRIALNRTHIRENTVIVDYWKRYKIGLDLQLSDMREKYTRNKLAITDDEFGKLDYVIEIPNEMKDNREIQSIISQRKDILTRRQNIPEIIEGMSIELARISAANEEVEDRLKIVSGGEDEIFKSGSGSPTGQATLLLDDRRVYEVLSPYVRWHLLGELITAPSDFVVMLLAMLMGGVGGILSVAKSIVDRSIPEPSRQDYFLRPLFGMLTALVVFVLFKAGQLALSSNISETASLNPFVVGFIGVVSGAMAKPAIDRIERAGASLFGQGAESNWYARGLKPRLDALASPERAALVSLLSAGGSMLGEWEKEKAPVSDADTRIIAAFLRLPVRDLFSSYPAE